MSFKRIALITVLLIAGVVTAVPAVELKSSYFDQQRQSLKYSYAQLALNASFGDEFTDTNTDNDADNNFDLKEQKPGYKSPGKALIYSLAVPGLGQYYYGSKTKAAFFLGAEITSWALYLVWHAEGGDLTDEFEAFNREHWHESRYVDYLQMTYGYSDDEDIPDDQDDGIIHNLPNTQTQQYYEMTGKYDQFAWGWEDAVLDGDTLDANNPPPKIYEDGTTPYSSLRYTYEDMRDDANKKYDNANKMIVVSILNRLISGFEAYFMSKHRNNQNKGDSSLFSRVDIDARMKSYYSVNDTPFLKMTFKF